MITEQVKNEVLQVKRLGDTIGYGHLMELAHEIWAQECEKDGLPRMTAFCVAAEYQIKKQYLERCRNRPPYGDLVRKALAEDDVADNDEE